MDSDTRKIVVLAVLAVGMLAVILFYIFSGMSKDTEATPVQVGTFPVGTERTDALPENPIVDIATSTTEAPTDEELAIEVVAKKTDWRDEVVEYSDTSVTESAGYNTGSNAGTDAAASPYSRADLNLIDFNMDYRAYVPEYVTVGDKQIRFEDLQDPERYREVMTEGLHPSVADEFASARSCGTADVPANEKDYDRFVSRLDKDKAAICMGEAILSDCTASRLRIDSGDLELTVYLGERGDGTCGMGLANNPQYVQLCTVESILNATGKNRTLTAWQAEYEDEPGELFARLLSGLVQPDTPGGGYNCQLHRMQ